jgi:hypothetical protein
LFSYFLNFLYFFKFEVFTMQKMLIFLMRFCLVALLAGACLPALAWDETGHKITAYIAWQQMSPAVRDRVFRTMLKAPDDSEVTAYWLSYGSRSEEVRRKEFFVLMATWADIIKDRTRNARYRKYNNSNWHYTDTFWTDRSGRIEILPAPEDGGLALEKIIDFDKVIRGTALDEQKAIAIVWLEHLIGDIHQPLHTSARVTETEPKGDQGGNLFYLTPKGTPREKQDNLHSFWDGSIGRTMRNEDGECDEDYIEPIAQKIMKQHPLGKLNQKLAPGRFADWVKESLSLAQQEVYSSDLKRAEAPSDKYRKKAFKIAQERLALAGYRIGTLFNEVFGTVGPVQ